METITFRIRAYGVDELAGLYNPHPPGRHHAALALDQLPGSSYIHFGCNPHNPGCKTPVPYFGGRELFFSDGSYKEREGLAGTASLSASLVPITVEYRFFMEKKGLLSVRRAVFRHEDGRQGDKDGHNGNKLYPTTIACFQ